MSIYNDRDGVLHQNIRKLLNQARILFFKTIEVKEVFLGRKKKYVWFRFPTDPIFFCRPCYFFNAIDRATLFSPGGCGLLPKWRLLSR
jgi:hypothetical protein